MNDPSSFDDAEPGTVCIADRDTMASGRLVTMLGWCFGIAVTAALVSVVAYIHTFGWHLSASHEVWNQAGGYFGGVLGPAFGFLSLLALLVTVMLQREQLSLARTQLADSQTELVHSRAAYDRQQFESTFFELLKLTRELVERFKVHSEDFREHISAPEREGAEALDSYAASIVRPYRATVTPEPNDIDMARALVRDFARDVYGKRPSAFGPYFRAMYQTFKHIDDSPLTSRDKIRYANIARGQVSEGAVLLLALNGLTERGYNFIRYIEQFGLLEHMHHNYRAKYKPALLVGYHERAFLGSANREAHPLRLPMQRPDFFIGEIQEPIAAGGYPANPIVADE